MVKNIYWVDATLLTFILNTLIQCFKDTNVSLPSEVHYFCTTTNGLVRSDASTKSHFLELLIQIPLVPKILHLMNPSGLKHLSFPSNLKQEKHYGYHGCPCQDQTNMSPLDGGHQVVPFYEKSG
jgi:hypothetical protein